LDVGPFVWTNPRPLLLKPRVLLIGLQSDTLYLAAKSLSSAQDHPVHPLTDFHRPIRH
jgi:hypothetical protein